VEGVEMDENIRKEFGFSGPLFKTEPRQVPSEAPGYIAGVSMTYDVIYADPPWKYSFSKSNSRKIENQYPTMTCAEICAMEIPSAKDCVLYLWATAPKLLEALAVMTAWGFTYKTQAVWDKGKIGMGFWFRGQHEILLVGVRGKVSPPEQGKRTASVYKYPRGKHSKKPDEIRNLIKDWFPNANRLEMFCREADEGWAVYGNEVSDSIAI
jgi:N6-adenosine-specific RNA methylase IME4